MKHIIRIGPTWIRFPLLIVAFPFCCLEFFIKAMMPIALGGNPNKWRVLSFCWVPEIIIPLFFAAWDGEFVPCQVHMNATKKQYPQTTKEDA